MTEPQVTTAQAAPKNKRTLVGKVVSDKRSKTDWIPLPNSKYNGPVGQSSIIVIL